MPNDAITIEPLPPDFEDWEGLLDFIRSSFAYMDGLIDPPSSAHRLTEHGLREKALTETCLIARENGRLAGCIFLTPWSDHFYVGKLAVEPSMQGRGIGRLLMAEAERTAQEAGAQALELQVRVELTGNQAAFARLGFVETARTSHEGFTRPTSITMRKMLG